MTSDAATYLPLIAAVALIGATTAAVASAGLFPAVEGRLRRLSPRVRFVALLGLAAVPVIAAGAFLAVAFVPSLLDLAGIIPDHCNEHGGHAFHLCFVHGAPPRAVWPIALSIAASALLARAFAAEAVGWRQARSWATRLRQIGSYDAANDAWLLDGDDLAVTIGAVRPEVFISDRLSDRLGATGWRVVLAHEHEHRRRRDALAKSMARTLSALHLPWIRRRILVGLDIAAEQACDEHASALIGSPTDVAATIVAMARAVPRGISPRFAEAFGAQAIEERVHALLDQNWVSVPRLAAPLGIALAATMLWSYESLHHGFETLLNYFF